MNINDPQSIKQLKLKTFCLSMRLKKSQINKSVIKKKKRLCTSMIVRMPSFSVLGTKLSIKRRVAIIPRKLRAQVIGLTDFSENDSTISFTFSKKNFNLLEKRIIIFIPPKNSLKFMPDSSGQFKFLVELINQTVPVPRLLINSLYVCITVFLAEDFCVIIPSRELCCKSRLSFTEQRGSSVIIFILDALGDCIKFAMK